MPELFSKSFRCHSIVVDKPRSSSNPGLRSKDTRLTVSTILLTRSSNPFIFCLAASSKSTILLLNHSAFIFITIRLCPNSSWISRAIEVRSSSLTLWRRSVNLRMALYDSSSSFSAFFCSVISTMIPLSFTGWSFSTSTVTISLSHMIFPSAAIIRYSNSCGIIFLVLWIQKFKAQSLSSGWIWSFQKEGSSIHIACG